MSEQQNLSASQNDTSYPSWPVVDDGVWNKCNVCSKARITGLSYLAAVSELN